MGLLRIIGIVVSPTVTISLVVLRHIFDPLLDRLGLSYPIDRQRRIDDLKRLLERVLAIKEDFMRRNPYQSSRQALIWLDHVDELDKAGNKVQYGYRKPGINIFRRWYYARAAAKESKWANDLVIQYKEVSQESRDRPGNYRDVKLGESVVMAPYMAVLSSFIQEENNPPGTFGIWGMGGVGKTALLESLYNRRWEYAPLEFIYVPAGRGCTVLKLQESIVALLGLGSSVNLTLKYQIYDYLMDRNFVLILDDMWAPIRLAEVGIPFPLGVARTRRESWLRHMVVQRRVILATRQLSVCTLMSCYENTLHMVCPNEQEAMRLFTAMAGEEVMKVDRIPELALQITKECDRLPNALCKLGKAMSIKYDPQDWMNDIESLRESKIYEITHTQEDLLESLRYSYDHLEGSLKPCFLICSMWPERVSIPIDKLIQWWGGLGLLGGADPDAYRRGLKKIEHLLASSLLEKGDNNLWCTESSNVRMHSMIRHMAMETVNNVLEETWIPSSSFRLAITKDKWYSVQKAWVSRADTGPWLKNYISEMEPKLTMLVSQHNFQLLPLVLFRKLVFLDMEGTQIEKFPSEICTLINLEYLNLSSTKVSGLPERLTRLAKLKYLILRSNMSLQTMPKGLIARLQELQVLDVFRTGIPSLLNELRSPDVELRVLGLTVRTEAEIEKLARLPYVCPVYICLHSFKAVCIDLHLVSEMDQLRELSIVKSSAARLVAESTCKALPHLLIFQIRSLPNLQSVRMGNIGLGITTVQISYCDKLLDVAWLHHLVRLEELTISYCKTIKTMFTVVSRNVEGVSFPKLKKIHLQELPELSSITECPLHLDSISYFGVVRCSSLRPQQHNQKWWNKVKVTEEVTKDMHSCFARED